MVYLLIRVTVVNSEQFLNTYHKLKSIRKEAGCTKLFCFSKKNYPEVVTLIAEWPSRSSYDDFRYRTEDDYQNLFRPEFTEIHELDCVFQQTIIPEYNKKQIHLFQRAMIGNTEKFVEKFIDLYKKFNMENRGMASVSLFQNMNNESIITLLGRWENQEALDNWAKSDERFQMSTDIETSSEADTYYLSLIDHWEANTD